MPVKNKVFGLGRLLLCDANKKANETIAFEISLCFQLQISLMQKVQIIAGRKNQIIIFPNCPLLYSNILSILPPMIEL